MARYKAELPLAGIIRKIDWNLSIKDNEIIIESTKSWVRERFKEAGHVFFFCMGRSYEIKVLQGTGTQEPIGLIAATNTIEYVWVFCPECDEEYMLPEDDSEKCVICGTETDTIN